MLKFAIALLLCTVATCAWVGGWTEIDVDDETVVAAAKHASLELSNRASTSYHLRLYKVVKARSQVVAGVNFDLKVIVGVTECKKREVNYEDVENCEFQDNVSTYRKCDVRVYRDLKGNHKLVSSGCILASRDELY